MGKLAFLLIIYLTFISLGLPDSLLGVAWPEMVGEFTVPYSAAGVIAMTISGCTIISSLSTMKLTAKLGTGKLVLGSVLFTAIGLIGIGFTRHYAFLLFFSLPLGLGAGAIDTSLNEYVALNFRAHHMNWLHAFWGIGATLGPILMGSILRSNGSWRAGYWIIGAIQMLLVVLLFFSLPLWKQGKEHHTATSIKDRVGFSEVIRMPGVVFALLSFIFYVGIESTIGLWGSSFLIEVKGISVSSASFMVSTFYGSLTVGRILSGFITFMVSNRKLLILSEICLLIGVCIIGAGSGNVLYAGFIFVGIGSAAIFPTMLHETPRRFGARASGRLMSLQLAFSSFGTIVLPPLIGVFTQSFGMGLFPMFLFAFGIVVLLSTIVIDRLTKDRKSSREIE